ncbi:hypothetical protein [Modestobacter excelsi]|uniref:hypothetical protein n=1 Tax=Modestobacter excelsi TaxID=2213161 RepID=UPI001C20E545|nr:hypothetical protein [Modestobacter excelsi]
MLSSPSATVLREDDVPGLDVHLGARREQRGQLVLGGAGEARRAGQRGSGAPRPGYRRAAGRRTGH